MVDQSRDRPHIYLPDSGESENYTSPRTGTTPPPPPRDRERHANELARAIGRSLLKAQQQLDSREPEIATGKPGFYLEFQVLADQANAFEKLENRQKKIELVAVHKPAEQEDVVKATVFVPEAATDYFLSKVEQYRDQETKKGKPKNEALVARLETVEIGTVRSLFTEDSTLFPQDGQEVWWEVWLRRDQHETFNTITERLNIQTKPHAISFPEREVVLAMADVEAMARLIKNSDAVAELRIAKDTPSMFLDMGPMEQVRWARDLADRILEPGQHAIALCLLDSGVTRTHPLIEPALESSDMHTYEPRWGVDDNWGHGTQMAGLALYSDLLDVLQTSNQVKLRHRLESVKILQPHQPNDPELYGAITQEAVARPEIQAPTRRRVFCMAVTSVPSNQGTPSSWSAAIDQLCFGEDDWRRLMVISVGNIRQDMMATDYLDLNDVSPIENPGQAWNPLIVGAYTEKINIIDPTYVGWQAVAPGGDLSPRSRTSVTWNSQWPIRPDVVFEGGNLASDGENPAIAIDDLCLLTTDYRPNLRLFNSMRDTSCATALASYMAARIMSEKPTYLPETIRALIVHSAEWTPAMQRRFQAATTQNAKRPLLRRYGYGVPNLERALQSANNDLTLIVEDELQPFYLDNNSIKTREMKLHSLPWPHEELERLREENVELKVTLSYFIEPNPGERGWGQRHRYASYGLRFEVNRSLESHDDFRRRINRAAREEEENTTTRTRTESDNWFLGSKLRNRGSIHSDIWYGTAVDLAQRSAIAVYPVGGWWKDKKYLERWHQSARYSLIVSIRVPEVEVDIYTPVLNRVKLAIDINT